MIKVIVWANPPITRDEKTAETLLAAILKDTPYSIEPIPNMVTHAMSSSSSVVVVQTPASAAVLPPAPPAVDESALLATVQLLMQQMEREREEERAARAKLEEKVLRLETALKTKADKRDNSVNQDRQVGSRGLVKILKKRGGDGVNGDQYSEITAKHELLETRMDHLGTDLGYVVEQTRLHQEVLFAVSEASAIDAKADTSTKKKSGHYSQAQLLASYRDVLLAKPPLPPAGDRKLTREEKEAIDAEEARKRELFSAVNSTHIQS